MISRVAFSGLLYAGKDTVAEKCGFEILSIAEPMYRCAEHFFGHCDKGRTDIRRFLQTIGQWGWGYQDSDSSPCDPVRAVFTNMMRTEGYRITNHPGDWSMYGSAPDFWIRMLLTRLKVSPPRGAVAVTNCRFEHELALLTEAGFEHYVVACSEETRRERYRARNGVDIPASVDNDVSEKLARELIKTFADRRIIWNDHRPMPMFRRYLTVEEFKALVTHP